MQLQELVKLVESEDIGTLYLSGTQDSYYMAILEKGKALTSYNVEFLDSKDGVRWKFESLDDVYELTRTHLHHHQFTVF